MKYLDLTLPTPAENLALDEALLDDCETSAGSEVLRLWEPTQPIVVLGYANRFATEVDVDACARAGVPILRRTTGGGTVLQGPGCFCYAVVLRLESSPSLDTISGTNCFVLDRVADAVRQATGRPVERAGDTDLIMDGLKFAGNAQRRKRHSLLFHGSLLLNADLGLIDRCLAMPSRQPAYRGGRGHRDFLRNLGLSSDRLRPVLRQVWRANEMLADYPRERVTELVRTKYGLEEWSRRS